VPWRERSWRPRIHEEDYTHDRFLLEGKVLANVWHRRETFHEGRCGLQVSIEKSMTLPYSTFEEGRPSMMGQRAAGDHCENWSWRRAQATAERGEPDQWTVRDQRHRRDLRFSPATGWRSKIAVPCGCVLEVLTVFHLLNTIPTFETRRKLWPASSLAVNQRF